MYNKQTNKQTTVMLSP